MLARIAMMAITTSNSINVNALFPSKRLWQLKHRHRFCIT